MKRWIYVVLLSISTLFSYGQSKRIDSLRYKLSIAKTDTAKITLLEQIAFFSSNTDSVFFYAQKALVLLNKIDFPRGKILTYRTLGLAYENNGNFPMALKSYLSVLEIAEKYNDPLFKALACIRLASFFATQQNFNAAEQYLSKAKQIVAFEVPQSDYSNRCFALLSIGESYFSLNIPDSALKYTQQAYELALEKKVTHRLPGILGHLGDIHQRLGNNGLALEYYRAYQNEQLKQGKRKDEFNDGIAKLFLKEGNTDSALYYAKLTQQTDNENKSFGNKSNNYFLLADIFDKKGNIDSAYYYTRAATKIKDSIYSKEKEQQIQNLTYNEQQRQHDIEAQKQAASTERKKDIQYALLALGIIGFLLLFLLLSHSFITNERIIRFLGVVALLIIFEFLNLLLHPFLERITSHSPIFMLLAMVCIAALLVPAHHQLEKWMTHTMVEKNKKVRLEAAKKTIQQLEGN
jgi:hypothetical protein